MGGLRRIENAGDLKGKRVLVRVDFNVPMQDGAVTDATRLKAALPTIEHLRGKGAKVILLAHFGRPKGKPNPGESLKPVAAALSVLMQDEVKFAPDCVGPVAERAVAALNGGQVLLLENTRFHPGEENTPEGEKKGDERYAQALAALGDIYINDAFSAAHREHASTAVIARFLPAYAGLAMQRELDHLALSLEHPKRPVIALVGGAKVSTKIDLLQNLVRKVDRLFIGGAMANTFLHAQGKPVGASLCEKEMAGTAKAILAAAKAAGCDLMLPSDVVTAKEFKAGADSRVVSADEVSDDEMILDCGSETVDALCDAIELSHTLIWNGPLGAFEIAPFDTATMEIARFVADQVQENGLVAVAGGGDTVAALNQAGVADMMSFVSTAGGAFLEWMEGKALPGVEALRETN